MLPPAPSDTHLQQQHRHTIGQLQAKESRIAQMQVEMSDLRSKNEMLRTQAAQQHLSLPDPPDVRRRSSHTDSSDHTQRRKGSDCRPSPPSYSRESTRSVVQSVAKSPTRPDPVEKHEREQNVTLCGDISKRDFGVSQSASWWR